MGMIRQVSIGVERVGRVVALHANGLAVAIPNAGRDAVCRARGAAREYGQTAG